MIEQGVIVESNVSRKKVVAVTMSTSRQGIGVVKELSKTNKYQIRAITRNINSSKALELESLMNVELVKGDLMDPESLNKAFEGVDIIFDVGDGIPLSGNESDEIRAFRSQVESDNLMHESSAEELGFNNVLFEYLSQG